MTSEEIGQLDHVLTGRDGRGEEPTVALCFWVRELALQSAIRNEQNARIDAEDAEERRKKPEMLNALLDKASGAMDRIAQPFTTGPFYVPGMPGQGKPE